MAATKLQDNGSGTETFQGDSTAIITAAETNQLFTGRGRLVSVAVENVGTSLTLDIYDHATTTTNKIVEWVTADGKVLKNYDYPIQNGLRVTVGGTPGVVVIKYRPNT